MKIKIVLTSLLVLLLASCNTSKSIIADNSKPRQYQYASLVDVMSYEGSATLMDAEVYVYNAVSSTNLTMIGDQRINELSYSQKEKLLLVRYGVSQTDGETNVTVNFVDYMTGRPIASCRGTYGTGLTNDDDLKGAMNKVTAEMQKIFGKK